MPVMLHLKSTKPPTLEILPSSVDFTVVGQVDVYVMNPNKTSTAKLAFTIGIVRMLSLYNHLELLTMKIKHHPCMVGVTGTSLQRRPLGFYQWDKGGDQSQHNLCQVSSYTSKADNQVKVFPRIV